MRSLAMTSAGADDFWGVAWLLDSLREMGARDQAATLTDRLPGAECSIYSASKETARISSGSAERLTAAQPLARLVRTRRATGMTAPDRLQPALEQYAAHPARSPTGNPSYLGVTSSPTRVAVRDVVIVYCDASPFGVVVAKPNLPASGHEDDTVLVTESAGFPSLRCRSHRISSMHGSMSARWRRVARA